MIQSLPILRTPDLPDRSAQTLTPDRRRLREAATDLEAMFLSEMLGHAGLGKTSETFGGGPGEEAFASLLVREQARVLADRGGVGLAERLFEAMVRRGMTT